MVADQLFEYLGDHLVLRKGGVPDSGFDDSLLMKLSIALRIALFTSIAFSRTLFVSRESLASYLWILSPESMWEISGTQGFAYGNLRRYPPRTILAPDAACPIL